MVRKHDDRVRLYRRRTAHWQTRSFVVNGHKYMRPARVSPAGLSKPCRPRPPYRSQGIFADRGRRNECDTFALPGGYEGRRQNEIGSRI
ncbi:hypothetical protein AB7M69_007261 [Bradyrhizobium japonicum]